MLSEKDITRFHSKHTTSTTGCELWQDALDKDGYGTFFLCGKARKAHRVAWLIAVGPVPAGKMIGHNCRNRACVNPSHIQPVTARENSLLNSNSICAVNAQKTMCKLGHPLDKSYKTKRGSQRYCSLCQNAKQKRLRSNRVDPLKGII